MYHNGHIMESEVKWALESITTNKASGGDGIPVELFQILKDNAVKVLHSVCQQIWKTQQYHRTGKGQFSFQSQRKALPRNAQTNAHLHSSHTVGRRRWWHPTPVLLPGKPHGQKGLVGCGPWGCEESDTTEWLPFHFSLSCIGEGNGKNSRDGGAWWAAVCGVTQSRTWLKWLSSSSSTL